MKIFERAMTLLVIAITALGLVGCVISKDKHEKILAQLEKTKAELAKANAELSQANAKLGQANTKIAGMEKLLADAQHGQRIAHKKQTRGKQLLRASLASAQREAAVLRQQMDELTQRLLEVNNELNITRQANEILRGQIDELTKEKR